MPTTGRSEARDGFSNKAEFFFLTRLKPLWKVLQANRSVKRKVNAWLINRLIYKIKTRPNPLSTMGDYTSWDSLIDRTYTSRHLPPKEPPADLPPVDEVVKLFARRPGKQLISGKSTMLFSYFAQWFTDGFLRTDRSNYLKNTSNHEIDLSPLYGLNRKVTDQIRSRQGGKLKSQLINGEEYPLYHFNADGSPVEEFKELAAIIPEELPNGLKAQLFAMGGDRANVQIGYVMLNTLFLREHNRICDLLAKKYPSWDDERLFQTARNVVIVELIKIVIEEYINHISPYHFQFIFDAEPFASERWYRQNWMSLEFSLVYRWHGMVPDKTQLNGQELPTEQTMFNNELLTSHGLGAHFEYATLQPAGEIGLMNTPPFLLPVERASIELGRMAKLASYNDYREMCRWPRVTDFDQITGDVEIQQELKRLYGHVDKIELYVGMFAEEVRENSAIAGLVGRLVGIDAFSQAITNPLLSENVFNETTFSPEGLKIIAETSTLSDVLHRNLPAGKRYKVSMTRLDR